MAFDIDAEELSRRQQGHSTTPADERRRCEACGSTQLRPKSDKPASARQHDEPYHCDNCGEHVDGTGGPA